MLLEQVGNNGFPVSCIEFEADVFLLFHATKISRKFQTTVHIGNVLQTAVVKWMSKVGIP